jgi:hypothetical protein
MPGGDTLNVRTISNVDITHLSVYMSSKYRHNTIELSEYHTACLLHCPLAIAYGNIDKRGKLVMVRLVRHTPSAGKVARKLGDGVLYRGVPGLSTQRSHSFVHLDHGGICPMRS